MNPQPPRTALPSPADAAAAAAARPITGPDDVAGPDDVTGPDDVASPPSRRVLVGRFVRHYAEMVLAMVVGMLALGTAVTLALDGVGVAYVRDEHPYLATAEMGLTMAAGMALWMRHRRHRWRHVVEMSAAMLLPLVFLFPLAWTGGVAPTSLPVLEHLAMFPLMLAVMLCTPHAYTGPATSRWADRLRARPRLRTALRRTLTGLVVAALAVAAPLGLGFAALQVRTDDTFTADRTAAAAAAAAVPAAPPAHDPSKPTAVVVVGAKGAVAGDTLAPFETLAASKAFNTYLVAPARTPSPLAGGLDVVPQLTFAELRGRLGGGAPDAVIVPAMPDAGEPSNAEVRDWLAAQSRAGSLVVGVCSGARVVASAGLLDGHAATSHWYRVNGLERDYPAAEWRRGVRYVDDGQVVTTAGILSGIDGTLRVVERFAGQDVARSAAAAVHWRSYSPGRPAPLPVQGTDELSLVALLNAGYRSRPTIGVRLHDAVSEIALAAVFDVYEGQSFAAHTVAVAPGREPVTSRHGLTFVPRSTPDDAALERTIVPGGTVGFAYDATLAELARTADAPTARWTAKALEYHPDELTFTGPGLSPTLVARPVLLAAGVAALLWALIHGTGLLRRRLGTRPR